MTGESRGTEPCPGASAPPRETVPLGLADMPRVDAIWRHPLYRERLERIEALERDRAFCRHGLPHLLDVARIMWISVLEAGRAAEFPRDLVYAAALLHDIGRATQYETGEPHDAAGARIAGEILGTVESGCSFTDAEREMLLDAVGAHRDRAPRPGARPLAELLRAADKASRPCFACPASRECNWPEETRNLAVRV